MAMEVEQKQGDVIQQFVLLAATARGRAAVELITHATSHPQLFAFSELLSAPHIAELKGTDHAAALDLLRLFAYGTWSDYRSNQQMLPALEPQQVLKLKQLTIMTLAETAKVLPYYLLMQELEISNVRGLEDLLINDCMYAGIVRGKLDQRRRCFEVQFAAGRDLRPGQLDNMIATLANWLDNSDNLLLSIQEKIMWADSMSDQHRQHKKEVEDKVEEVQKSTKKLVPLSSIILRKIKIQKGGKLASFVSIISQTLVLTSSHSRGALSQVLGGYLFGGLSTRMCESLQTDLPVTISLKGVHSMSKAEHLTQ